MLHAKMSKASRSRPCPALGHEITPADCGEQRQSRLICPADCPHNPFAPVNYSHLLEIEERLDRLTLEKLSAATPDRTALEREISKATRQGPDAIHAFFVWQIFFAQDARQATLAGRWEKSGLAGLKNDERVLLRSKMQIRVILLEVHRVLASGQVEGVDLLSANPAPMIFQDRSLAGMATRFATLLCWVYPLPHYWRLSGTAMVLPAVAQFAPPDIVREIVRHLSGPVTEPEIRRWLAEHFRKFRDAQTAVSLMRRQQMFARIDAKFGKVVYELRAPFAQCRDRLDAVPEVHMGDLTPAENNEGFVEARDWIDKPGKSQPLTMPGGQMMLGRVLLGQSLWRLETMGAEKLARLRRQFERQMGERVRFSGERVDDLGAQLNARGPAVNESLVPARLLENPEQIALTSSRVPALPPGTSLKNAEAEMLRAADQAFLEDSVPALGGLTPRQAALDPGWRPKLIQLMKQRVQSHDQRNLQTGRTDDINWMLRELQLDELDFEPPPWRPPPPKPEQGTEDSEAMPEIDEPVAVDPNRPPAPPLPDQPLDIEEASERLESAMDLFASAAEAERELRASGATLLEDAEALTLDLMTEADFCFAIPFLLQIWFALVPAGCRAPEIDFDELGKNFAANLRELEKSAKAATPKKLQAFFQKGPQPEMMLVVLGAFIPAATDAPKEIRPSPDAQPVILALLKTVVETLDAALRRK